MTIAELIGVDKVLLILKKPCVHIRSSSTRGFFPADFTNWVISGIGNIVVFHVFHPCPLTMLSRSGHDTALAISKLKRILCV